MFKSHDQNVIFFEIQKKRRWFIRSYWYMSLAVSALPIQRLSGCVLLLYINPLVSGTPIKWIFLNSHKVICHLIDHRVATTDGAFFTPLYLLPIWEIMCAFILPITRLYMLHAQLVKFFLEHRCALVCVRLNTNISGVL